MEKNVSVTDDSGSIVGATYPKRARGLVKKGRARWIGEGAIRLTPGRNIKETTEEESMPDTEMPKTGATVDLAYILGQIELVRKDDEHIRNAISILSTESDATEDQAAALAKLVHEREETNRVILDFYRKIYEDMNTTARALTILEKAAGNSAPLPVGEITNLIYKLLGIEKTK